MEAMMEPRSIGTKMPAPNQPTVYQLACEQGKAAEQLASLLETLNSCVRDEPGDVDKQPCANGTICNLMHRTSDDLQRALRLANELGQKLGADELRKMNQAPMERVRRE